MDNTPTPTQAQIDASTIAFYGRVLGAARRHRNTALDALEDSTAQNEGLLMDLTNQRKETAGVRAEFDALKARLDANVDAFEKLMARVPPDLLVELDAAGAVEVPGESPPVH